MEIKIIKQESKPVYQAKYYGLELPPVCPRMGMGSIISHSSDSYGTLLDFILEDIVLCSGDIKITFSDNIDHALQQTTRRLIELNSTYFSKTQEIWEYSDRIKEIKEDSE